MEERMNLIEQMDVLMDSWDGTAESAPAIIESMKLPISQLRTMPTDPYTEKEITLLTDIHNKEQAMVKAIRTEKDRLMKEMRGMNKKDNMIQNYLYPKKTPVFVNQNL